MSNKSRLCRIYLHIKDRCYNPNCNSYKNYGARGITICDVWRTDFNSFKTWAISNGYSDALSIDRIDNNKGYSPDNCRWATKKEQCNNRRSNHLLTYKGQTKSLAEWCRELKLNYWTTKSRINVFGWTVDKAFNYL